VSAYLPPQHGAWAFLGLPLALGLTQATWTPWLLVLAVAWIAAFPLSYAALALVRSRKAPRLRERYRRPFAVWLLVVLPCVLALLVARPWLLWVGVAYVALFAVNVFYARRGDERALANDLVFIAECSAMVAVVWGVGETPEGGWAWPFAAAPQHVWVLVAFCALVLAGSTLHVKSLIRERADARYARASVVFAWGSLAASVGLAAWWGLPSGWWLVVPFAFLAARAHLIPGRGLRPAVIGLVELAAFVLAAVSALLARPL